MGKKIAIEGMPGSGKTSCVISLAQLLGENCLLLPEINLEKDESKYIKTNEWHIYHQLWLERIKIINNNISNEQCCLFDRTYLSTLAYTYALGVPSLNDIQYQEVVNAIEKDFSKNEFDLIIVLYTSPAVGLNRRRLNSDEPPRPWSDIDFLNKLQTFYTEKLPGLVTSELIFIETDKLTLAEVKLAILEEVLKAINIRILPTKPINPTEREILNKFASEKQLGPSYHDGLYVLGYPTLYFRQYCVQLEGNIVCYFNNERLKLILSRRQKVAQLKVQVACRAIVLHDEAMLLVSNDGNTWYTPGGRLEGNESLTDCVEREVYEETGLLINALDIIHVFEFVDHIERIKKIELYFGATTSNPSISCKWQDIQGPVKHVRFIPVQELNNFDVKPKFLADKLWHDEVFIRSKPIIYIPPETKSSMSLEPASEAYPDNIKRFFAKPSAEQKLDLSASKQTEADVIKRLI